MSSNSHHGNRGIFGFLSVVALGVAGRLAWLGYRAWRASRAELEKLETHEGGLAPGLSRDRHFGGGAQDSVEEASMESFPASDAPGWR